MATEASAKNFFSSPHFAVVGASNNPSKFGYKIFAWYISRSFPVTPINPSAPSIAVNKTNYPTLPSLSALPNPKQTSVSIITPPAVTKKVLEEARELGIRGVWLQPGTFDDEIIADALKTWEGFAVGGDGGGGGEGWCVLVDGDKAARAAGVKL